MGITYLDKPKQPAEILLRYMDFEHRLATGDTVAGCNITATDEAGTDVTSAMIVGPTSLSGTRAYYTLQAGDTGRLYKVRFVAQSTAGATVEEDLMVPVKNY